MAQLARAAPGLVDVRQCQAQKHVSDRESFLLRVFIDYLLTIYIYVYIYICIYHYAQNCAGILVIFGMLILYHWNSPLKW